MSLPGTGGLDPSVQVAGDGSSGVLSEASGSAGTGGGLPLTGAQTASAATLGVAALAAGSMLALAGRRRPWLAVGAHQARRTRS